ncbi:MAG: Stage sporulation family protein [Acidimicrobiales bacterium]|nr:Stage sporulation family protein [Acidimicrobiales bacterium]
MSEQRQAAVEDDRSDRLVGSIELLAEAARRVHGTDRDLEDKVEWTVDAACRVARARFAAYVAAPDVGGGLQAVAGCSASELGGFAGLAASRLFATRPAERMPIRVGDVRRDKQSRALRNRVAFDEVASYLAVPVVSFDDRIYGALLLGHPEPDHFDRLAESLVAGLATHLGVALDNLATIQELAEQGEAQREVVHQLQEAVRPPMPSVEGAELGVHYLPADPSAPTGGDLYDWLVLPDGTIHLAVVDVVGKGVAATKDAVAVTHALRLLAVDGCPLDRLVARADELVTAHSPDLVATVAVVHYRPADGVAQLAGGGHPPPLLVSADGNVRQLSLPGIPIGWPGAGSSEVVTVDLARSETLILYTDGLIESTKDILVGLESLDRAAAELARYPAGPLARALVERALAGAMRRDDSLALVLRRRTPPDALPSHALGPLHYQFSPSMATVPLARHLLADWLDMVGIEGPDAADLLLVASELCANAVRHSSGAPSSCVLRAWSDGDAVVVEVEDDGIGFELPAFRDEADFPGLELEQGRGLFLAHALTDELFVARDDDRTVVRAVKRALISV